MAIIGLNTLPTTYSTFNLSSTGPPYMLDRNSYVAVANESVDTIGIFCFVGPVTCTVQIGLYEITADNGAGGGSLVYSDTISGAPFTASTWYTKPVSWSLTAGTRYAVAATCTAGAYFRAALMPWAADSSSTDNTINGTLPATWTDSVNTYRPIFYANTAVSAQVDPTITFSNTNGNTDIVDLNGTHVTGNVNVSIFTGANIESLGTTPEFEGTLTLNASGEGTLILVGSTLTTGQDVLAVLHQAGTPNRSAIFTQID